MKRLELEKVVEKQLGQVEKYALKIPGYFEMEDIHELRVEYKKSRAFLRLLQHHEDSYDLHIPRKIKQVYKAAGDVLDLQLFIARINSFLSSPQQLPHYLNWLQHLLFEKKERLVKEIEHVDFKEMIKTVKRHLPGLMENSA